MKLTDYIINTSDYSLSFWCNLVAVDRNVNVRHGCVQYEKRAGVSAAQPPQTGKVSTLQCWSWQLERDSAKRCTMQKRLIQPSALYTESAFDVLLEGL